MKNCSRCGNTSSEVVQCSACKNFYDYPCAGITESGFRKLGADRRASWKCIGCKNPPSPSSRGDDSVSLAVIHKEILDMKQQLAVLPKLTSDIECIRSEIRDLSASCEFNHAQLAECNNRVAALEQNIEKIMVVEQKVQKAFTALDKIQVDLDTKDQWTRLNNIEIKGIPVKTNENLFTIFDSLCSCVKYTVPKSQINYLSRVPTFSDKEKTIVVSFLNRYVKEDFIALARAKKNLTAKDLGYAGSTQRIFVNDHLTPNNKRLLTKTKTALKNRYQYIWVKFGKIHVRQNDTSKIHIIQSETDLNKLS